MNENEIGIGVSFFWILIFIFLVFTAVIPGILWFPLLVVLAMIGLKLWGDYKEDKTIDPLKYPKELIAFVLLTLGLAIPTLIWVGAGLALGEAVDIRKILERIKKM